MVKDILTKLTAAAVVIALAVAPALGLQCTMSCGDSGACCCSGAVDPADGLPSYSSPSCCEGEFQARDSSSTILPDRISAQAKPLPGSVLLPSWADGSEGQDRSLSRVQVSAAAAPTRARPSPLFILNASLLI